MSRRGTLLWQSDTDSLETSGFPAESAAIGVHPDSIMRGSVFACLALLSAAAGMAATSGFLLGVDYTEWLSGWPRRYSRRMAFMRLR